VRTGLAPSTETWYNGNRAYKNDNENRLGNGEDPIVELVAGHYSPGGQVRTDGVRYNRRYRRVHSADFVKRAYSFRIVTRRSSSFGTTKGGHKTGWWIWNLMRTAFPRIKYYIFTSVTKGGVWEADRNFMKVVHCVTGGCQFRYRGLSRDIHCPHQS
jgi:hypothetical protein